MDVAANPTYIFSGHGVGYRIAGPEGRDAAAHPLTSISGLTHRAGPRAGVRPSSGQIRGSG